jgi:probable F420-dependent oxidoreductase
VSHARRFRFGVEMVGPFDGMTWAESAQELEAMGYSTLFVPDHFHEGLGPITAMASAAAATTSLVVAPMVLATDFRHPAVLARELASIDQLSAGRLEVGLGAGYQVTDYEASGIAMDPPGVRVDRLIEHVQVLRGLFAGGPFTFHGDHYRIDALAGSPRPARPGGPPILIAGGGRRLLTFAATAADIVGVNVAMPTSADRNAPRDALAPAIDEKFRLIREAAGARVDELEFHGWLSVVAVTGDSSRLADRLAVAFGGTPADALESPLVLVGSEAEILERLEARRERWGYSYFTVPQAKARELAGVVHRAAGR